jgi:predicted AAA+ superfamily ATPase
MTIRQVSAQLFDFINRIEPHKNVIIVKGARQVGKTFLIEQTLSAVNLRCSSFNLERNALLRDEIA